MRTPFVVLCSILVCSILPSSAVAQVKTGTPTYGSFSGSPDVINNANLNIHLSVPVIHKPGRGTNFDYDITYDSSVWNPATSGGSTYWQPVGNWGWSSNSAFGTGLTGYVTFGTTTTYCYDGQGHINGSDVWVGNSFYADPWASGHSFAGYQETKSGGCGSSYVSTYPSLAKDGSGLTINGPGGPIITKDGTSLSPPVNPTGGSYAASVSDRNGNLISTDSSGNFFDTLSGTVKVLSVAGTAPSPVNFTYTAPSGGNAQYKMNFTNYTVATNFAVSGIREYKSSAAVPLVTSIVLPDNSQYTFLYEATPALPASGACTPYSGTTCVTARIAKITLPTGGYISYTYTGGSGSNGSGIFSDGSAATLSRTVSPGWAWTYAQVKGSGAASTTTITDPLNDITTIQFQGIYETQRQVNQGSSTLLLTTNTCYNGAASPCNSTAVALPITQRATISRLPGNQQSKHADLYSTYGMPTESDDYDYGAGAPGALIKKVLIAYASLGNINAFQQQVTVCNGTSTSSACNGTGTVVSQTSYNYDETALTPTSGTPQQTTVSGLRGNLTTVTYPVGTSAASHNTYFDTGMLNASTDSDGAVTSYSFPDNVSTCGNAFPTKANEPLSMSRFFAWNCTGGVMTTLTDENSNVTTTTYNDLYFWRPASQSYPDGGITSWTYTNPTSTTITQKMNSTQSVVTKVLLDGLGRATQQQLTDPQGPSTVYVDTTYDSLGRLASTSNPYRSTSDSTYGITSEQYDALNRPTLVTPPDGSTNVSISYTNNCITKKDQAGKSTESCADGLGRATQVFEDPAGLNLETDYTYDALGNVLTVNQVGGDPGHPANWRTRTYTYDGLSRLTSEKNPESGTVSYTYNTNGDLATKIAPAPNQTGTNTVTTTYTFDLLHRLTQKSYSDTTPLTWFQYDSGFVPGGATPHNTIGRLVTTRTPITVSAFSYDVMGRPLWNVQSTPQNCCSAGWTLNYSYDLMGNMLSASNGFGTTFSYTYDAAARPKALTSNLVDAQHPAAIFTADATNGYFPHGALRKGAFGNGLTQSNVYDKNLNPCLLDVDTISTTLLQTCGDSTPSGNVLDLWMGYNAGTSNNGNLMNWNATGAQSFVRTYGYDSLNRVSTMGDTVSAQPCKGLSWSYDNWGNRTGQTMTSGSCGQFSATADAQNRVHDTNNFYQYDAAGNMTHDASHSYTYNAENRLTAVDGGNTANYYYDAFGYRVHHLIGSSTMEYVRDLQGNVVSEVLPSGGLNASYMYFGGSMVAEYFAGTTYFIHQDHLGSTRLVTGYPTASIAECDDYYPYGEANANVSTCLTATDTTYKFTAHERDTETNLDHTWLRKYSSTLGRWMTPDPGGLAVADLSNPQSWNRYGYVLNNPGRFVDWFGLCGTTVSSTIISADGSSSSGGSQSSSDPCPPRELPADPPFPDTNVTSFMTPTIPLSVDSTTTTVGCVQPTKFQQAGIKVQKWLANWTKMTIGVGAGISATAGRGIGVNFTASRQWVVSPNGQAALVTTLTSVAQLPFNAATTPGAGAYGGFQISVSNARTPQELKGTSFDYGYGGGSGGWGGGGDFSGGNGTQGRFIWSVTGTGGAGAGKAGHGFTTTTTTVVPTC
jgi:RHS repeat-associated protein